MKNLKFKWLLLSMILSVVSINTAWADDADVADIGGVFSVNGTTEKYKIASKADYLNCTACTDWSIKGWTSYSGHSFGNVYSFKLKGIAVSGWATKGKSDWFAAKIFYKIYASGSSEPSSNTGDFGVGHYGQANLGNTSDLYKCDNCYESDNSLKKVIGMDNQDVDLIGSRSPGVYNMKIYTNTQSLWNNGSQNGTYAQKNDYTAVTATFTVMPKVTFSAGSGTITTTTQYVNYNSSTKLSTASALGLNPPTGRHFDHWTDGTNNYNDGANVTFTTNKTLTAIYANNTYTITYKDQYGGSYSGSNAASLPSSYTYGTGIASLTAGTKTGYSFDGWYTAQNCSSGKTTSIANNATGNKTFYAKWVANITLHRNGGDSDGAATTTYNSNANLTISTAPGRTGYYVTGYYAEPEGTTLIATSAGVLQENKSGFTDANRKWIATEAKTLYPQWDNHYTITFNQHDPSFEGTESTTAEYGQAMPTITVPSKSGYIFGGYYTAVNGGGTRYYDENGESVRTWNLTADTELHAKWTGINYQVAFDANEGTGNMANEAFTYGAAEKALTTNTYTRSGYYFLGWNSNADGSGTAYYNGKSVQNLTTIDGGIVTLYAQWAKKYTLYFVQAGCNWNPPYAKAQISYDGQTYYPLGGGNGMAMTSDGQVYLTNITYNNSHYFNVFKIANVPEGALIKFSNNGSSPTSNMSWTAEKPYFIYGNSTWYALDGQSPKTISKATNMVVHLDDGSEYGIDKYGDEQYAIVELSASHTYHYKYYNWLDNAWSGYQNANVYIMNENTTTGVSAWGAMNSSPGQDVYFYTTVAGEYKFMLSWDNTTPKTKMCYPVGVDLSLNTTEARAGDVTTVRLTAAPKKTYLITNPTYYYQVSTDNNNWVTIATTNSKTYDYTFEAKKCYFRVILQNDAGLKSTSDPKTFTAYSTRSFYVYNPYNNSTDKWKTLHLYTWDSNDNNTRYNGDWPGKSSGSCINGNDIISKGGDWYYITIDERANCFMLVGDSPYQNHQTITCYVNNYRPDEKYMIYTESNQNKVVAYQAKGNKDYRLKYTEGGKTRYSPIYNTTLDGTTVTTSMWMNAANSASLVIQQGNGNNLWTNRKTYTNSSDGFAGLVDSEHRDHGYVFQMQVTLNTGTPTSSTVSNVALYTGSYYVRTDGLDGGWNIYKKADHTMHHSEKSLDGTPPYDYYLCKWIGSGGTNVKFTIANDYNPELVEALEGDASSTAPLYNRQTIPQATNVRFSWNTRTNTLTRAYLSAATDISERFLMLVETSDTKPKIYKDEDGSVPANNELIFADMGNWVYLISMKANPQAKAKVTAKYNDIEQEFIPSTKLIDGTGSSKYSYRIIYDFKTNILTNAWVAGGADISTEINLNTNVMVIRNGQNPAAQIHFTTGQVINAKKLIGVMQFEYDNMVGKMNTWNSTAYQYCMYYISFPFNVKVSDIFGIGEFGIDWRLQYYDGAERASKGFFTGDGTTTFWKDVPASGTLNAYEGYSLLLNRIKFNDKNTDIWENKDAGSSVYLYFPSTADADNIKDQEQTIHVPEHTCTINRTFEGSGGGEVNHQNTDSHWNMMGTPLFEDKEASTIGTPSASGSGARDLKWFYAWNSSNNTLQVRSTLDNTVSFPAMYSYMVQYAGDVTFSGSRVVPNSVAARRAEETKNYNIKLQVLDSEDNEINQTFVTLEEGASADFVLNEDMYMVTNKLPVNIFTFAGNYEVAGNVLPLESSIVPVGVIVKTDGTYRFSMPSNFSGTVTLVDTYSNTRTDLSMSDYEVNLTEGTFTDRFLLELNINKVVTSIDGVNGEGTLKDGKAHKFIEDGVMYILRDGKKYDTRGARVQ